MSSRCKFLPSCLAVFGVAVLCSNLACLARQQRARVVSDKTLSAGLDQDPATLNGTIIYPGYPELPVVPDPIDFSCSKVRQAGFYADMDYGCQVVRHCDIRGSLSSFVCPTKTLFNQITLVCDWYFNVQCNLSSRFYDYSNSRLYGPGPLLDDEPEPAHQTGGSCPPVQPNPFKPIFGIGPVICRGNGSVSQRLFNGTWVDVCAGDWACPGNEKCCPVYFNDALPCGPICQVPV